MAATGRASGSDGTALMGDQKRSANGSANRRSLSRARQRARHRTAMRYHGEYRRHLAEQTGGGRPPTGTEKARAMQAVCSAHPRAYRRFYEEQLAVEQIIPLPIGMPSRFPHGTLHAWRLHSRNGEPRCAMCQAWWDGVHTHRCVICEREFVSSVRSRFCGNDCRALWSYLRYWASKTDRKYRPRAEPWERATVAQERARRMGLDLVVLIARWRAA